VLCKPPARDQRNSKPSILRLSFDYLKQEESLTRVRIYVSSSSAIHPPPSCRQLISRLLSSLHFIVSLASYYWSASCCVQGLIVDCWCAELLWRSASLWIVSLTHAVDPWSFQTTDSIDHDIESLDPIESNVMHELVHLSPVICRNDVLADWWVMRYIDDKSVSVFLRNANPSTKKGITILTNSHHWHHRPFHCLHLVVTMIHDSWVAEDAAITRRAEIDFDFWRGQLKGWEKWGRCESIPRCT